MSGGPVEAWLTDLVLRRSPFVAVLRMGLPLALGLASHVAINLVNLLFVGRLGDVAMQAAHVASTWNFLPMILGNCVSTALLARLSRLLGEGDHRGARRLHRRAEVFMLWFGTMVAIVTALPATWAVDATGLSGAARADAVHYLVVSNLGCLPMFVLMQTTAAMRAAGEVAMPLAILVGANIVNVGLDVVLMFGWQAAGVPPFGVVGAAWAAGIARTLAAAIAFAWLVRRAHVLSLRDVRVTRRLPVARPLLRDAWPQMGQIGLRAGIVVALTVVVQRVHGDSAIVALGITTRLDTLILFSSLGFANAATVYAARAVVARMEQRARWVGIAAALQAAAFGAVVPLVLTTTSRAVVDLFLPGASERVHDIADLYFRSAMWAQVLSALGCGAIGAVQGAGRMVSPLLVDVAGFAVAFAALAANATAGLPTLFAALVAGQAVVAALHLAHVAWGRWPRAA